MGCHQVVTTSVQLHAPHNRNMPQFEQPLQRTNVAAIATTTTAAAIETGLKSLMFNIRCAICLFPPTEPTSLPCNHCFCAPCILTALKISSVCPICKLQTTKRMLRPELKIERIIQGLETYQRLSMDMESSVSLDFKAKDGNHGTQDKENIDHTIQETHQLTLKKSDSSSSSSSHPAEISQRVGVDKGMVPNIVSETPESLFHEISATVAGAADELAQEKIGSCTTRWTPAIGCIVQVAPRTWPGINKGGGTARITRLNLDHSVNVQYILGGKETHVALEYISATGSPTLDDSDSSLAHTRRRGQRKPSSSAAAGAADDDDIDGSSSSKVFVVSQSIYDEFQSIFCLFASEMASHQISITSQWKTPNSHVIIETTTSAPANGRRHLVARRRSMKYLKALVSGKWILGLDYIQACLAQETLVDAQAFEVCGDLKTINLDRDYYKAPCRSRVAHLSRQSCRGLFQDLTFHLLPGQNFGSGSTCPSARDLSELIVLGQGKVIVNHSRTAGKTAGTRFLTVPEDDPGRRRKRKRPDRRHEEATKPSVVYIWDSQTNLSQFLTGSSCHSEDALPCVVRYEWILDTISAYRQRPLEDYSYFRRQ